MAQTGYTPILIYSSSTASNLPSASNLTNSTLGSELAINIADGKLFYKDTSNAVQVIAWKVTPTSAGGTGLTSYASGDMLYYASGTILSKLTIGASGTYMSSSGTAPQWNAPAALTKTDDTNVTLTLGGNASTALLNAASLTLGWAGQLAVTRGGTGLATVAQGDILYGSASNTLSALTKNTTATRYLSNTGTSNNPAWAQIDLSNGVTGTLPTGNGGTGLTSFTNAGVLYASSTSALATSSNFAYNGTLYLYGDNGFTSDIKLSVSATSGGSFFFKNTAGSGQWLGWMWNASTSGDGLFVNFMTEGGGTGRGSIIYNRGAGLLNYNTTSDYRAKDILGNVIEPGQVIDALKIYMGKMKGATIPRPMLVAHEAQQVTPYSVTGEKDAVDKDGNPIYQQMDHSSYVPLILAELQSLRARVLQLEGK